MGNCTASNANVNNTGENTEDLRPNARTNGIRLFYKGDENIYD